MKAVLLVGGFSTTLRPITLTTPLPLLEFCNTTLLMHQLRALKDAGVREVLISVHERTVPKSWDEYVLRCETELGITITCAKEDESLGTAGPLKAAEAMITSGGAADSPFFVVNCDVLCSYPLKDLLHTHVQQKVEATVLTTRVPSGGPPLSAYGVVVVDERTGRVRHFVEKPQTFVSDVINAGVYVFSPSIFARIAPGRKVSMNEVLPALAHEEQLHSMLLSGYWCKIDTCQAFLGAMGPHLEIMRFMRPGALTAPPTDGSYEVRGDVMVHPTASIGAGCVLGPRVVVGPGCVVGEGVRLEDTALLEGVEIRAHALVKASLVGWRCVVGRWAFCEGSILGEEVSVNEGLLVRGATVLPHKELAENIRTPQIVI